MHKPEFHELVLIFNHVFCMHRDEGVHWGIQNGLQLSRSTIMYFKHNDMESLRNTLEKVTQENKRAKKLRRYIVVEAVYQVSSVLLTGFYLVKAICCSTACTIFTSSGMKEGGIS